MKHLEAYLGVCQIGIIFASLVFGWISEPAVAAVLTPVVRDLGMLEDYAHGIAVTLMFTFLMLLYIVIGEQVPKNMVIRRFEALLCWTAVPLRLFLLVVYLFFALLNVLSDFMFWMGNPRAH